MKKKKIKRFIFPGTALIASTYFSFLFAIGAIIGYIGGNFFHKKFIRTGRIEPIVIDLGNWQFHLHHWISGTLGVSVALLTFSSFSSLSLLSIGALGGVVFHDIYTDKKGWYKVISKRIQIS